VEGKNKEIFTKSVVKEEKRQRKGKIKKSLQRA